jgi:phosphoglucosamine mutase
MKENRADRLFGTDGIRGAVGTFPLDKESLEKLGNAIHTVLEPIAVIMGGDTRHSCFVIQSGLMAGILNRTEVHICDVISTPGLSYLVGQGPFDYGIMITASHNVFTDNGIKILAANGEKISDDLERQIEDVFFSMKTAKTVEAIRCDAFKDLDLYKDLLRRHLPGNTGRGKRWKIVLDCANGAVFQIAPEIFGESGFDIHTIHAKPTGLNINEGCGSTQPASLQKAVIEERADLGIAFDGDGDRVIFVGPQGRILDGDYSLLMIADLFRKYPQENGFNDLVVGTVMSNLGLEKALRQRGIRFLRTPVGDRYVYAEMKKTNAVLGGEQSGHTILRGYQKTGDGILTALFFLKALLECEVSPADVHRSMTQYPQVTRSIRVKEKKDLGQWDEFQQMVTGFNEKFGENSRLVVRYSGTEAKIRIMIESELQEIIDENINKFEGLIKSRIGA